MYANGRYWKAKVRGAGGVTRSKGKEGLFWGKESKDPHVGYRRVFLSSPPSDTPWPCATKLPAYRGLGVCVLKGFLEFYEEGLWPCSRDERRGNWDFFSVWEMGDQVQRRKLSRSLQQTLYPFDEDTGISY